MEGRGAVAVKFEGSISDQRLTGETVTVVITCSDKTKETLITQTLADKTFSTSKVHDLAGNYTAQAHMDADGFYKAWDSEVKAYTIALQDRTGTFTITLA